MKAFITGIITGIIVMFYYIFKNKNKKSKELIKLEIEATKMYNQTQKAKETLKKELKNAEKIHNDFLTAKSKYDEFKSSQQ